MGAVERVFEVASEVEQKPFFIVVGGTGIEPVTPAV